MSEPLVIGVLTSGGDAPGMNAAIRAVVRTALNRGARAYAIYEGFKGAIEGKNHIRQMGWLDVGGIIQRGGTEIGTARCPAFHTREGRLKAAKNLLEYGIDRLVVIGGDGSLTGATIFYEEWPSLVKELLENGQITPEIAEKHATLRMVGLVGSIDNDMSGTDMTIGADTALHRITEALDAISSTAASHHRTFVVEVMGRNCGYLALMGAVSGGADWVFIPESPIESDNWEAKVCESIRAGRQAGRRESIVVVAEGARDRQGNPITSSYVRKLLEEQLGEDTRVTILGHVQRGGTPSAFDRWMSSLLGFAAVERVLSNSADTEPQLVGLNHNRIKFSPLMQCVEKTHKVADEIANHNYTRAIEMRNSSFKDIFQIYKELTNSVQPNQKNGKSKPRLAIINAGAPAPGMNSATQAAVRMGTSMGYNMLGVKNGFNGLINGLIEELSWGSVDGWGRLGGAELGTSHVIPHKQDFYSIARTLEINKVSGLLVIGGWDAYEAAYSLQNEKANFPAFNIPIICLPASIDNNLPGSELSIGTDTALNNIVQIVDKIKQSAVAALRCFVVEVMGGNCGYLALMSGLAAGAERVYLPEHHIELRHLQVDLAEMMQSFKNGKRLSLMIRNEHASRLYNTDFLCALFEEENQGLFEVRQVILGHLQEGGNPTPFDRIQATRLASHCVKYLDNEIKNKTASGAFIGYKSGKIELTDLDELLRLGDPQAKRPRNQWWLELEPISQTLSNPNKDRGWGVLQWSETPENVKAFEGVNYVTRQKKSYVENN
jgi:6-phosphofructokinase 1